MGFWSDMSLYADRGVQWPEGLIERIKGLERELDDLVDELRCLNSEPRNKAYWAARKSITARREDLREERGRLQKQARDHANSCLSQSVSGWGL